MNFLHNLPSASFRAGHAVAPVKERKGGWRKELPEERRRKEEGRERKDLLNFFVIQGKNLSAFLKNSLLEPCHEAIHTLGHWSISLSEFKCRFLASNFYSKALIINICIHM